MPTVKVYNLEGKEVDDFELSNSVFGRTSKEEALNESEIQQRRQRLFYEAVRYQMAKKRSGNHATKSRSLISGGGRKPFRQKGTGRARAGTTRAPHWRGGGVVHGPRVRSHALQMNKKTRKAALCAALAHRSEGESLRVIESFELTEIKTKKIVSLLGALDVTSALFVVDAGNINLQKSAKNIPGVKTIAVEGLNVYDILKYDYLLCTPTTANSIVERLSN